ncbi:DUF6346 domain-containing protein [Amycolatopsis lexingtonensis]|uniref:DUF6346 domain-containing protein n=1 Tax=Amycolatopsis lexingtonensis TaxID=218822 RepID=UPI003F6E516D
MTTLSSGYESVPVVRRPQWGRIAAQALLVLVAVLALWSTTVRGMLHYGPDRPGDADAIARVTSCDRIGPVSRGGIGFYWVCTADVTTEDGAIRSVRFGLNELTPDDIGKPVPVERAGEFRRAADKLVVWWAIAPGIAFLLGIAAWSVLHRRRRLRHRVSPWQPTTRLVAPTCVLAAGAGPGGGRGRRKIAPNEWSAQRYWRLAGSIMVAGGVCAVIGAFAGSADAREILTGLGLLGLAAPMLVYPFTPRAYRSNENATAVTISSDGIGWYRRGETTFDLEWAEVAEVRMTTIAHDGLVLRVVDLFLANGRRGDLWGLWQLGAQLGAHRLPGEKNAYRLPEAFSDAAARQVREAMLVYRPDRYREFAANLEGAPPTPITRGAT